MKPPLPETKQQYQDQFLCSFRFLGYNHAQSMVSVALQADGNPCYKGDASMLNDPGIIPNLRSGSVSANTVRQK